MIASTSLTMCWICPETFSNNRDLKNHLMASPHSCMRVICPWCTREESTYRRMTELKNHVERRHAVILKTLQPEFFSESNGFWLSLQPENYKRIVSPNAWESTMAIRTRAAVLSWLEGIKRPTKGQKEWESGWDAVIGKTSKSSQYSSIAIRSDTPMSESRFVPDYDEEIEEPQLKRPRCESYSPTRPEIQVDLEVQSFHMTGDGVTIQVVSTNGTLWYRCDIKREETNARFLDTLLRRVNARMHTSSMIPPPVMTNVENPERELKLKLAKIIGINKDAIIRISRASATFTPPRADDEPSIHIPTTPKDQNQNLPMTRCTMMKTPSVAEEAPKALDLSQKNSSPLPIQATDTNISKKCLTIKERVLMVLKMGSMPLLAPARRDWKKEMQFTITEGSTVIHWPPEGWTKMTPDQKLLTWEYAAMTLETGAGSRMNPALERSYLLDKFNMLALPGTAEPAYGGEMISRKARYYNYEWLRQLAIHGYKSTADEEFVEMVEGSMSRRDKSTDDVLRRIHTVPLRIS
ncbi:hypothetical protein ACJMK2_025861 [Sinanodonta woodiana]|uniref:C2H2-type domain-containing protein n=1 Tax=Sinanodonta woodiana TaxID=1069815 RepID=A0ABD3XHT3_SINWO